MSNGTVQVLKTRNVCSRCHYPTNLPLIMMGNHYNVCWACHQDWHKNYYSKLPKPVDLDQYNEFLEKFKRQEPLKNPFIFR